MQCFGDFGGITLSFERFDRMDTQKGMLHLYIGDGKGKTTASVGLAVRATGAGKRVLFLQFLKGRPSGEVAALSTLGVQVFRTEAVKKFFSHMNEEEKALCTECCTALFRKGLAAIQSGTHDLVIMDELLDAFGLNILEEAPLLAALVERAAPVEVVLTGRNPSEALIQAAGYITEMKAVRHPFTKGISARCGIEY